MEDSTELEHLFYTDCRDKKRTGRGISHRASRTRKHEAVVMPNERLNKFEKKVITGGSPVKIYNLSEVKKMEMMERIRSGEIPHYREIEELGFDQAQACFAEIRRLHTNAEIAKPWKLSNTTALAELFDKYMVAKTNGKNGQVLVGQSAIEYRKKFNHKNKNNSNLPDIRVRAIGGVQFKNEQNEQTNGQTEVNIPIVVQNTNAQPIKENENLVCLNKRYSYKQFTAYLERLAVYLDPESEFEIELKIKEV